MGISFASADSEPPNCAVCNEHCNLDCACGHSHHYCGCECHLRQERWALGRARIRRWRDSGVAWFWSSDREDFGSVILEAGRYVATTVRGSAAFEVLGDTKDFVEEHSS